MMRGRPLAVRLAVVLAAVVVLVLVLAGVVVNRAVSRSIEETLGPGEQQRLALAAAAAEGYRGFSAASALQFQCRMEGEPCP